MVTTPVAILSSVCAQLAGVMGMPVAGDAGGVADPGAERTGGAPNTRVTDSAINDRSSEMRGMPILGLNFNDTEGWDKCAAGRFLSAGRCIPNQIQLLGRTHIVQSSNGHCMRGRREFLRIMAHFLANRGHGIAKPIQVLLGLGLRG